MRVAFVGKGGNGKSTIAALFSLHADSMGKKVALFDLDVNSHTNTLLGIECADEITLSHDGNPKKIREVLAGTNKRIRQEEFLKTTPPGRGSHIVRFSDSDPIMRSFSLPFGRAGRLLVLGSYKEEGIGSSCHHGTQTIAENILWHTILRDDEVVVIDNVAGNDCFANTLFYQDLIVFIVRPEMESVNVYGRFKRMAEAAGVGNRVFALGNSVGSEKQRVFLEEQFKGEIIGLLSQNESIADLRMAGKPLSVDCISREYDSVFSRVYDRLVKLRVPNRYRLERLYDLHRKEAGAHWVERTYRVGLTDQIDPDFSFTE